MDFRAIREKRSSASTLSDMELFVFPELMYSLLLANIMSPRIWRWRDDAWFAKREKRVYRRITRLKQYVMDHYAFNLDLDTWGLTTKERELARFRGFIDEEALRRSNALFGYEGDKYYFDIDIRTHFGLDRYTSDTIPYWKTETVEAMDAFRHREGYDEGAGECVSLAMLYAAALFLVGEVPLSDIYLMATPLHSQNFVDVDDGILTNNRRLVTKNMWFNGTALSAQARRALENERVTIVCHETGHIHTLFPEATIAPERYAHFAERLRAYLRTELNPDTLGSFLRNARSIQRCFQVRWPIRGMDRYIPAERVFAYEVDCPYLFTDNTREKLMGEIDAEEFEPMRLESRIVFNELEDFVAHERLALTAEADLSRLRARFASDCLNAQIAIDSLIQFCRVEPRLPDPARKQFAAAVEPLGITGDMSREAVIERLESIRGRNPVADLAFYAYRDVTRSDPEPFVRACVRRSPVSVAAAAEWDDAALVARVEALADESIYDGAGRLAQPDEVWNFGRGDGLERALLLANLWRARRPEDEMRIEIEAGRVRVIRPGREHAFATGKGVPPQTWPIPAVGEEAAGHTPGV